VAMAPAKSPLRIKPEQSTSRHNQEAAVIAAKSRRKM
jgi:hypothetical protein